MCFWKEHLHPTELLGFKLNIDAKPLVFALVVCGDVDPALKLAYKLELKCICTYKHMHMCTDTPVILVFSFLSGCCIL